MALVLGLILVGFGLLLAEVFLPGGVVGFAGVICLIAGVGLGYLRLGATPGHILLLFVLVVGGAGTVAWLKLLPKSRLWRWSSPATPVNSRVELLNQTGVAVTPLRPTGVALIDSRRVDVTSESEFVESGARVEVVRVEGRRVVVRSERA